MLYCAYTCDYVIFSGFSQASRNFLANFREGARKRLNRAENRGGLGIIRDDLGSYSKVLKTVCPKGTGVRIPLPAPNKRTTEPTKLGCFFVSLALVREDSNAPLRLSESQNGVRI